MNTVRPAAPDVISAIARLHERQLTPEEREALEAVPISDEERQATQALIEWFTRRYPTARERLAYVRRAYASWTRGRVR